MHGSLCGKLWSEREESRRRSFKLVLERLERHSGVRFLVWSREVGLLLLS